FECDGLFDRCIHTVVIWQSFGIEVAINYSRVSIGCSQILRRLGVSAAINKCQLAVVPLRGGKRKSCTKVIAQAKLPGRFLVQDIISYKVKVMSSIKIGVVFLQAIITRNFTKRVSHPQVQFLGAVSCQKVDTLS